MKTHTALHLDWETRSACDLKRAGLHVYAQHPTTDVLMGAYCFDDGPISVWYPGQPVPNEVARHIDSGGIVWGHNVAFEIEICNHVGWKYGWPRLLVEQCHDTMVLAYAMGLPGSLANAAAAVGIDAQKDMVGQRLMLQLCQPRDVKDDGTIVWWNDEEKTKRLAQYCIQDVVVERELAKRLLPLSQQERKVWELDQDINSRGIKIDVESARTAIDIVESEKKRLDSSMRKITGNQVATCSAAKQLTDWITSEGVELDGVAKADVTALLDDDKISHNVREALLLRQEAAKSSTAKINAMVSGAHPKDHRVRGIFQYHGSCTGRWAGRRLQPQNLPRPKLKQEEIDDVFTLFRERHARDLIEICYGSPTSVVSDCIRGFIIPKESYTFIGCDFSAIEARVLAWLAGEEKVLDVFRSHGKIYEAAAADIYRVELGDVTKDMRQIGKVAVLALGYQGGVGAFQSMARVSGIKVSDEKAEEIKSAWRLAHPKIVQYWYDLENAAMSAVQSPGRKFSAGSAPRQVTYLVNGSFLFCKLPSGRVISYPYPKVEEVETPWGQMKDAVTYMSEDSLTRKWSRHKAYGGLWSENVTQAVARDLLSESMLRLEKHRYTVVMHVHDEVLCEVPEGFGSAEEMEKIMCEIPEWGVGLPIRAEGWTGKRYQK